LVYFSSAGYIVNKKTIIVVIAGSEHHEHARMSAGLVPCWHWSSNFRHKSV